MKQGKKMALMHEEEVRGKRKENRDPGAREKV